MPYVGGCASMLIVLPDSGKFRSIERSLGEPFFEKIDQSLKSELVVASMPKFTIQGATISLKTELAKLGMTDAFTEGKADFSRIVPTAKDPLFLYDVLHQAFVTVEEGGTEAAAATAVDGGDASIEINPPKFKRFAADRPFIFVIRDNTTNAVLFVGRLTDPS
jgi:serpin B